MRVITNRHFEKQLKDFSRGHRNVSRDVCRALNTFDKECAHYLGARLYKLRVRSSDTNKGKSGGCRLIVLCIEVADMVIPVTLYQKSTQENATEGELAYHLASVRAELDMNNI